MQRSEIESILSKVYPLTLIEPLLNTYENSLVEFRKRNWQYCGNELGQFAEIARRIIEDQLEGEFTPLNDKLKPYSEKILIAQENSNPSIPEVYRIIIPRVIYSMYCIRNKRGMVHKNHISPNKMDATLLISSAKWVVAELFRQASTLSFEETETVIDSIMNRESPIVWSAGDTLRVLDTKMSATNKVLCLLYIKDGQTDSELQASIEYKNTTEFKRLLKKLHQSRLIEYSDSKCSISPLGIVKAEELLNQ